MRERKIWGRLVFPSVGVEVSWCEGGSYGDEPREVVLEGPVRCGMSLVRLPSS